MRQHTQPFRLAPLLPSSVPCQNHQDRSKRLSSSLALCLPSFLFSKLKWIWPSDSLFEVVVSKQPSDSTGKEASLVLSNQNAPLTQANGLSAITSSHRDNWDVAWWCPHQGKCRPILGIQRSLRPFPEPNPSPPAFTNNSILTLTVHQKRKKPFFLLIWVKYRISVLGIYWGKLLQSLTFLKNFLIDLKF